MLALFSTVLVASLVGSLHCAGMCGGFVVFWAGGDASQGKNKVFAHMAYNGGRLVTYVLLGALALCLVLGLVARLFSPSAPPTSTSR